MANRKRNETETAADTAASREENARLRHTDELRDQAEVAAAPAGTEVPEGASLTTRHDATDLGVPMTQGSPDEPVGPEDALGPGPKRGDYRDRIVGEPHEARIVDGRVVMEPQRPRAEEIGDEEGVKGGVGTA